MRIFFIINLKRRDAEPGKDLIARFSTLLDKSGHTYEIHQAKSIEDTEQAIATAIDKGFDTLWIGGGDGTLNHALNCTFGKDINYGIVPMGTVNALARALRIPTDPEKCVEYLLGAHPVPMDVGEVNGHYFFTYATVGLHAALFHNIDEKFKKRWGKLAFWESAVRTVWKKSILPRFILEMELAADNPAEQRVVRDYGYSFTLSNMANYAGWSTITAETPASPGYFELHHFRKNRLMPMVIWFAFLRLFGIEKSRPHRGQIFSLIRWVKVRSHRKLSLQIDGEPIKTKDRRNLKFTCHNDSIRILLREDEASQLQATSQK